MVATLKGMLWHVVQEGPLETTPASAGPWQYWFAQAAVPVCNVVGPWSRTVIVQAAGWTAKGPPRWQPVQETPDIPPLKSGPWHPAQLTPDGFVVVSAEAA